MRTNILLVEDDESMGFLLVDFLQSNNFKVDLYKTGKKGLDAFYKSEYDFCLLDVMLPEMDGFTLAENIRKTNDSIPIVFLTAKVLKQDKLKGFDIGIDDYIIKPFDEDELLCRIQSILKRCTQNIEEQTNDPIEIGSYTFDVKNLHLHHEEDQKRLTQKESDVLYQLAKNINNVVKRDNILIDIWGDNDYFNGRSLDVFIAKLRKYLKKDSNVSIDNIPKVGFILNAPQNN
ncbi:response regulator transcription factor [Saccharicrinis aurantiacus]|uniref:response regulator transcription factor n=1 Tax=Saccharicrinis aurantiacus TaxID=1849719 RepID=UPI000838FB10|nr:response regulator transcription factor [Saccharicrinis aurantiacus]